jgi:hypothetical protein
VPIDLEVLRRLYVDEKLTTSKVAARLGCAATTVVRRLRQFEIPARPRGPIAGYAFERQTAAPYRRTQWSPETAYVIGLIATDGNLSVNGRCVSITSKDLDLLETVQACLDLRTRMSPVRGGYGTTCHRIQWSDRRFYDWLVGIGLTPAKSLTLRPLVIPDEYFADFLRGCIDGDGSIVTYVDRYNTRKSPAYVYTRLFVSIVSASPRFLEWMQTRVWSLRGLSGSLMIRRSIGRRDMWCLRYAKHESLAVLRWIYYAPELACLGRKRDIAAPFLRPPDSPRRRGPGRPMVV